MQPVDALQAEQPSTADAQAAAVTKSTDAWRPFRDPLPMHDTWWLTIVPLALFISVAYKGVRTAHPKRLAVAIPMMTLQIIGAVVLFGVGVHLLLEYAIPAIS